MQLLQVIYPKTKPAPPLTFYKNVNLPWNGQKN